MRLYVADGDSSGVDDLLVGGVGADFEVAVGVGCVKSMLPKRSRRARTPDFGNRYRALSRSGGGCVGYDPRS